MGKKDIVDGVEMYATMRSPNGLECDGCGKRVNLGRNTFSEELVDLKAEGWIIRSTWHGQDSKDYCPDCAQ